MWKGKICKKTRKDAMIKLKFSFSPLYVNTKIRARGHQLSVHITPISKSLVVPVIWLALIDAIYSQITSFFALNHIFFPANEVATLKTKQPIRFQGLFKVTNQIAGKWKTKSIMWQILQLLFPKLLLFPPQKWMNLISDRLSTASIKYLNWPSPVFGRFQNGCNKVVIEPCVVQFWSEIILVISNQTRAARSFDFEITLMISAQIVLHQVQLPLLTKLKEQVLKNWYRLQQRRVYVNRLARGFARREVFTKPEVTVAFIWLLNVNRLPLYFQCLQVDP